MLDERVYTVETPEQIDLAYDVAGIGSRFLAALVDHVVIAMLLSLGCMLLMIVLDRVNLGLNTGLVVSLFVIGIYLAICGYYIFFETTWNGQTPGKRVMGIRMVRIGGRPIGFLGSTIRNLIRLADFLPVLYGIGMLVMFFNRRSCRLGDLAAGVLAVKEGRQVTLDMLDEPGAEEPPAVPSATALTIPNLDAVEAADYQIVASYLRRKATLGYETRQRIAALLMSGLQTRLGYTVQGDSDIFLQRLVAEYQLLRHGPDPAATEAAIPAGPEATTGDQAVATSPAPADSSGGNQPQSPI
jgi:uncharacterized RDD family membrane protein YckC